MEIRTMTALDDCLGRSDIREVQFDQPVSEDFIRHLESFGNLSYFKDFPRPFYLLDVAGRFTFRGVEGTDRGRLTIKGDYALAESAFRNMVSSFNPQTTRPCRDPR